MMSLPRLLHGRVHYAWIVVGVTFLTLLAAAGMRSTPSVIMVPLENEFGWTPATISLAVSINIVLYGLVGPFSAALVNRYGLRRSMIVALLMLGIGIGLTATMSTVWELLVLWGGVVGTGSGIVARVLGAIVATRWFVRQRGLVVGLLTASTATGQLVFLPVIATLSEHGSWRIAVLIVAAAALLMVPVVALFMRDSPYALGLLPYGAEPGTKEPPPLPRGNLFLDPIKALGEALGNRDFRLLALSFAICGASTNGLIGTHLIAACLDHGIPEITGAGLLAAMGVFDIIGTTASGWLSDRMDSRYLLCAYYGFRGLSLLFLPFALDGSFYSLSIFALFYGLDWVATVPPTVKLASNAFGVQRVGMMYGWVTASHQIGAATMALAAGAMRTAFGSYESSFLTSGALCLAAAILVLMIGQRPAPREKDGRVPASA
jgi:sugar phosphate permease